MYTLRKVVDNVQSNQNLGSQYQVIEKETNKNEFKKAKEIIFGEEEENSCYAIIVCNGGRIVQKPIKLHNDRKR